MLGLFDYLIWLLSPLAGAYVVVWALVRKEFIPYLSLNLYLLALASSDVCRFIVMHMYGFQSMQYRQFYYYTDGLVTIVMYLAIMGLYLHAFQDGHLSKYLRGLTVIILGATACFSFLVVQNNTRNLTGPFVVELARDLYFIGVVMTYILWGLMLKLRVTRLRIILLVSAFGLFFGLHAITYGLRNLYPGLTVWRVIPPLVGTWLPLSLAYTFTRVAEEARVATARVAGIRN